MANAVTLADAIAWLTPLIGAGGVTAIMVAWLGTRKPQRSDPVVTGIQALLADHVSVNNLANEMRRVADGLEHVQRGIHRYCDLMDIAQALDRLHHHDKPGGL
ncbi:MAG: hypothetical protein AB7U62_03080 [Pseudolabrys sp.]